jgi:hypothetical protein
MNFTFGIVTDGKKNLDNAVSSIAKQNIPNYEIIIVGGDNESFLDYKQVAHILYADKNPSGDISIKKNIITKNASYENIVFLHDYINLCDDWYSGFLLFGNNFNVCTNIILNNNGERYRDWCLWQEDANKFGINNYLIPYEITHLSKMMYISGAYWIAKKDFMINTMLNEKLAWGQGEDVEWSIRARRKTDFKINTFSKVVLEKNKNRIFTEPTAKENETLYNIKDYDDSDAYDTLITKHLYQWIN